MFIPNIYILLINKQNSLKYEITNKLSPIKDSFKKSESRDEINWFLNYL